MIACAAPFHVLDLLPLLAGGGGLYALRHTMRIHVKNILPLLAVALLVLSGCAGKLQDSTLKIAAASDATVDGFTDAWANFVYEEIAYCEYAELPTPEARTECMGIAANTDDAIAAVTVVVAAQHAIFVANQCTSQREKMLPEQLRECAESYDWALLSADLAAALDVLNPFLKAIRK